MSLSRYQQYRDSGVQWLGELPSHWNVTRLKYACTVMPSNVDKKSYDDEPSVVLCNYTDVYYNEKISPSIQFMPATASEEQIARFTLRAGDTLITKDSETADDIAISAYVPTDMPGVVCGYHLAIVRPKHGHDGLYIKRLFDSHYLKACFAVAANGLTRVGLSQYALDNVAIPLPPPDEQSGIAAFLDRETGKIDALIAEQEKLLTLLAEKRQATISHAVTRGLNPDAPKKDSGVVWLGEVPAHWDVLKGSRIGELFGSEPIPENQVHESGELPFIKVGSLSLEDFRIESWDWYVDGITAARCAPRRNFITFPKRGAAIFTNKVNIVECDALIDPNLMGWKIGERADIKFVAYILKVRRLEELADVSTVPQINNKHIGPEQFPVPPLTEQSMIVEFLDRETAKVNSLKAESERAIDLLKERRSALIAAAVTGKIDVRAAVPEELAA
ncbi:restriction endonuclease subunit S [Trinickia sp. Y13]|uniref:restriction endonuclease subunit S n=1 Tax=Trinickia sp. Y13 TaxID=2917807 RepID=UPI0024070AF1|nr:restriction endonuclease subunit S [Trinickia sp. Y13]MDG0027180.1 restriction endonuclease subunit S [Trinickia sp. Y13]